MNYGYYNNKSDIEKYNSPILLFFCRDKNWNFKTVFICDKENLSPEMYIEKKEWESFLKSQESVYSKGFNVDSVFITKYEDAPESNYGEETVVLYTTFPWEVRKLRKSFTHTYLSDIKWEKMCIQKMGLRTPYINVPDDFEKRWLKAPEIKELPEEKHFYVPIRWIGWDIETNAEPVFPNFNGWKDAEKCEIISISAYDSYNRCYHRFYWHPNIKTENSFMGTPWKRKGKYYIPAKKKEIEYDKTNEVYNHEFPSEIDALQGYFHWFNEVRPDAQYGFHSEGGYRISTKKGYSRKYWFNGFDMLFLYQRAKHLGLLKEIQMLSPMPNHINGVRWRSHGDMQSVAIDGLCQIDFIYTSEIFGYHKKFDDFREGNLEGFMSFFLGFGKIKHEEQIWEMWKNNTPSDYDPSKPEKHRIEKKTNLVKELYEKEKRRNSL